MEFTMTEAMEILERTPAVLRAMLAGIPESWIRGREGEQSWSPYEIVGHLIHGEHTDWIPRTRMILEHGDSRAFVPFDREAMLRLSQTRPLPEMLDEFEDLRRKNLEILKGTEAAAQLQRKGRHPDLGPVDLSQLLATWVVHDLGHLSQITRVMAKQYTDAVGPWRSYLPVLDTRLRP